MGWLIPSFWKSKKVFITGHTGFKGGWLAYWLYLMGAKVVGYALPPQSEPAIFNILDLSGLIEQSRIADIRDLKTLSHEICSFQPDIVIHMAAQPLVRYSYLNPIETYEVNVMGTANILEALRGVSSVKATVIVTTDKCYENQERLLGYCEDDSMGGYDPYSSSKGCAELLTSAYRRSYFSPPNSNNAIASARAGNVIGGGDWSEDRLVPDAIRAFEAEQTLIVRNPQAIRPWQHVLEPLSGYLLLAQALYQYGQPFASGWNFGPDDVDSRSVEAAIDILTDLWPYEVSWERDLTTQPYEATLLRLDCTKAKQKLNWQPKWSLERAMEKVAVWHQEFVMCSDMRAITQAQINEYQLRD